VFLIQVRAHGVKRGVGGFKEVSAKLRGHYFVKSGNHCVYLSYFKRVRSIAKNDY
jgi:hypothetical protein